MMLTMNRLARSWEGLAVARSLGGAVRQTYAVNAAPTAAGRLAAPLGALYLSSLAKGPVFGSGGATKLREGPASKKINQGKKGASIETVRARGGKTSRSASAATQASKAPVSKIKIPNAKLSPWLLFIKENSSGGQSLVENVRSLAERYQRLSAEEKNLLKSRVSELKKARDLFISNLSAMDIAHENKIRAERKKAGVKKGVAPIKDPNRIKRPVSGFLLFMHELRAKGRFAPGEPIVSQAMKAGLQWSAMTPNQKQPYKDQFYKNKAAYDELVRTSP